MLPTSIDYHYLNMAPIAIKKRTSSRAKASRISKPSTSTSNIPTKTLSSDALFPSSKKDKRTIKHSSFVSKIEKASSKSNKRRRPNKKLVANLESLADALPGLEDDAGGDAGVVEIGQAKIQRKSLKSRPGAMRRKDKLERMERERFNANLAQMAGSGNTGAASSIADRWAALKNHVKNTVETKAEFVKK
ncbi:ribosome biogenesis protein SLX9-domain-containing protein [Dendryphion nanum]|uniref:Ribosome biogenesis protein SLX9 n=1 Tax=Dendryphion nanum TaxID=256645 RepID=A0A9P9EJ16_9PLEO|nr:ribosome biogenesis protein SLX9-domain-containing protein [Dendryphion nanum]